MVEDGDKDMRMSDGRCLHRRDGWQRRALDIALIQIQNLAKNHRPKIKMAIIPMTARG